MYFDILEYVGLVLNSYSLVIILDLILQCQSADIIILKMYSFGFVKAEEVGNCY